MKRPFGGYPGRGLNGPKGAGISRRHALVWGGGQPKIYWSPLGGISSCIVFEMSNSIYKMTVMPMVMLAKYYFNMI